MCIIQTCVFVRSSSSSSLFLSCVRLNLFIIQRREGGNAFFDSTETVLSALHHYILLSYSFKLLVDYYTTQHRGIFFFFFYFLFNTFSTLYFFLLTQLTEWPPVGGLESVVVFYIRLLRLQSDKNVNWKKNKRTNEATTDKR